MGTTLTPTATRIIAIRDKAEEKTASGLYIPETTKERPAIATVQTSGPDVISLETGDRIVYKEYSATELKHEGLDYIIIEEDDVLAVIEEQEDEEEQ